jgi:hypothetical protein
VYRSNFDRGRQEIQRHEYEDPCERPIHPDPIRIRQRALASDVRLETGEALGSGGKAVIDPRAQIGRADEESR